MEHLKSIADLERIAKRRLPRMLYDFVAGGAEDELTVQANRDAFSNVRLLPRVGAPCPQRDLTTTVLGQEISLPVLLAPCGQVRLVHPPGGERDAALAATRFGTLGILSSMAGTSIEDFAAASSIPPWFQIYPFGGPATVEGAIDRARRSGFRVLVATLDSPVVGRRERDVRNGVNAVLDGKPNAIVRALPQLLGHPRWLYQFLRCGMPREFPNLVVDGKALRVGTANDAVHDHGWMTWEMVERLRTLWDGPLVVKGILHPQDALIALRLGVDGIIVSNHGGRQLDTTPATIEALPAIVDAVDGRAEVLLDGGIRRGADVVKAVALGARAVLIGRPYIFGLAAGGARGVTSVLQTLRSDMDRTLALLGAASIKELGPHYVSVDLNARGATVDYH